MVDSDMLTFRLCVGIPYEHRNVDRNCICAGDLQVMRLSVAKSGLTLHFNSDYIHLLLCVCNVFMLFTISQ